MRFDYAIIAMIGMAFGAVPDADWQETEEYVAAADWKTCSVDSDCAEGFACVKGLSETQGDEPETISYTGCNSIDVCKGTGIWRWRADEVFQVFCSDEAKQLAAALPDPEDITVHDTALASEWSAVCSTNSDCPAEQGCYPMYYQYDDSKNDYDNGVVCMALIMECEQDPNLMFGVKNANYATTGSEFDISYKCSPEAVGSSGASAIAATLIAALAAISFF